MMIRNLSDGQKIDIKNEDLEILLSVLKGYPYEFYAYGSRVKGCAREFSDLDLFYNVEDEVEDSMDSMDLIYEIKDKLEDSNISIKVSLLGKKDMSESFYDSIKKDFVRIK